MVPVHRHEDGERLVCNAMEELNSLYDDRTTRLRVHKDRTTRRTRLPVLHVVSCSCTSSARSAHRRERWITLRPNGALCNRVLAEDRAIAWTGAERLTKHPEACFGKEAYSHVFSGPITSKDQ